jgi:hypothetical protein
MIVVVATFLGREAVFSSEKFWEIDTVALSFVFDKYCPIID